MSNERAAEYAAAWTRHASVSDDAEGRANLSAYLSTLEPSVVYEDVPSGAKHEGLEGVTEFCKAVSRMFAMSFKITTTQDSGEQFAFEFVCDATSSQTGKLVTFKGVAIGAFKDGKVVAHRDYYDLSGFAQAGSR